MVRHVAGTQSRVAALLRIVGGAAPVLDQKQAQPFFGRTQILFWVHGLKVWVSVHLFIELGGQFPEGRFAADLLIERRLLGWGIGALGLLGSLGRLLCGWLRRCIGWGTASHDLIATLLLGFTLGPDGG